MIVLTNYKDYIKFLNSLYFKKIFSKVSVTNTGDRLKINTEKQDYEYLYENDSIKDFFNSWMTVNTVYTDVVNSSNNYQLFLCSAVQELLLSAANKKHSGGELLHKFYIKKKSGGLREIIAPCKEIKAPLQKINKIFQRAYDYKNKDFQVAYKKGKSVIDNAVVHSDKQRIFKIDLKDFFPSCKKSYVVEKIKFLFENSGNNFPDNSYAMDKFLETILYNDSLYIGNPVSGTLANAIISKPVKYLRNICKSTSMGFSVYADDMTFSSDKFIVKQYIVDIFNTAFSEFNMDKDFKLNDDKCYGLSKNNRFITGVAINDKNYLTCKRNKYLRIRQTLHQLKYNDSSHIVDNSQIGKMDKRKYWTMDQFKGNIAYAIMIDKSGKIKNILSKYKDEVKKYNLVSDRVLEILGIN